MTDVGRDDGLITSDGHRDEIEIPPRLQGGLAGTALPPSAVCQRRRPLRRPERLDFEGNVIVPLDEDAVRRALRRMKLQGVESLAVVFLFSFVNSAHERRVREIAAEELPGVMLSLSHEVMPSAPEFERTSTTRVSAYVGPKIERYLSRLDRRRRESGCRGSASSCSRRRLMPGGRRQKAVAVMVRARRVA